MDKKKSQEEDYLFDMLSKQNGVASANECTGMMAIPPQNEQEAEAYNEIYVVPKVINKKEQKLAEKGM